MTEFERRAEIEKAVNFLAEKFKTPKELTKPVLFHSLNIGFYLDQGNYPQILYWLGFYTIQPKTRIQRLRKLPTFSAKKLLISSMLIRKEKVKRLAR